jgi:hypothetical protein
MLELKNVTLLVLTSLYFEEHIESLLKSMEGINFGSVKFISHEMPKNLPENIIWEDSKIKFDYPGYNKYCIFDLHKHVDTEFCLITQHDSWVINPDLWDDEFLNYDYIGAPWPYSEFHFKDCNGIVQRVGNGGFSLRSKKFLEVPKHTEIVWDRSSPNEDVTVSVKNRNKYEECGCKFAPFDLAIKFSHEIDLEENEEISSFGFHGNFQT